MIILLRHGETFWNVERRVQGRLESDLTPRGERQALSMAALAGELAGRVPGDWRLVSSPSGRARRTADAVAAVTGLAVETDERLVEICCGAWEGQLWDDVRRHDPHRGYDGERFFGAPGGGETFEDVMGRATSWLAELPPEPERRVIAVSHGVLGRLLRGAYAGLDRRSTLDQAVPQDAVYRLQNGQIDRFDCEPID
ncbi:MAG: histidine phosphatase family protein [Phenylobacterium sp.]|uniref:histidine phosphatase family protein n=1 Tax=Phenylobacterium sp. TaxID=1871053 RepID=UPI001A40F5FF|nr:histidine phosphatase family protein [Phenylobacterium sp.]MBL8770723.1 histidine phosphatase family protein [Phenylobacterium sp.]